MFGCFTPTCNKRCTRGPNQEELAEPGDLAGRECKVRCELRQVWVMSN